MRPLETAWSPAGTVTSMSYVALSDGWSFPGNHAIEPVGSPRASAPSSSSGSQPSSDASGSVIVFGSPA